MLIEQRITENGIETVDKVEIAIARLREFEPPEGYYLAFSGGKDSVVIYDLAVKAGVKFDAHYNITTVDPPELVKFIKQEYPDVHRDSPKKTMWQLIVENGTPPTRLMRYCCRHLKEHGGKGRVCVTGVRWAESSRRKNTRGMAEFLGKSTKDKILFNDNDKARRMIEQCVQKGQFVLNPIIDWTDTEIWQYIQQNKIKYCSLYDEGFKRLGCIMCPMKSTEGILRDTERWPRYYKLYLKAFDKMLAYGKENGKEFKSWQTPKDVMHWWIYNPPKGDPDQGVLFE